MVAATASLAGGAADAGSIPGGCFPNPGSIPAVFLSAALGPQKNLVTLLDLCVSSLRRGHANLLCIAPILTDDPRRESGIFLDAKGTKLWPTCAKLAPKPLLPRGDPGTHLAPSGLSTQLARLWPRWHRGRTCHLPRAWSGLSMPVFAESQAKEARVQQRM